jgi:hypothetical protein
MKKIFLLTIIALINGAIILAQPPAGNANVGDFYGEKTVLENITDIDKIPMMLKNNEIFKTKVKAKVVDICPKKGCWIKLAVNDTTTAFVKMKDYAFFLPIAIVGKTIVLEGEVKLLTTSVNELKHYAEDAKKTKQEIDAITAPKKEIRFTAKGITVVQ